MYNNNYDLDAYLSVVIVNTFASETNINGCFISDITKQIAEQFHWSSSFFKQQWLLTDIKQKVAPRKTKLVPN